MLCLVFYEGDWSMNRVIATFLTKVLAPFVNIGPPQGWLGLIPHNLRPDQNQSEELEKLRVRHRIPNGVFAELLLSSSSITRRVQENVYFDLKKQMPNASEKELLEAVFRSRVFPQHPYGLKITEEEIRKATENINSLNDLKEYFVEMDRKEFPFPGKPFGIGRKLDKKITEILKG